MKLTEMSFDKDSYKKPKPRRNKYEEREWLERQIRLNQKHLAKELCLKNPNPDRVVKFKNKIEFLMMKLSKVCNVTIILRTGNDLLRFPDID